MTSLSSLSDIKPKSFRQDLRILPFFVISERQKERCQNSPKNVHWKLMHAEKIGCKNQANVVLYIDRVRKEGGNKDETGS